jgi:hypothetical protein
MAQLRAAGIEPDAWCKIKAAQSAVSLAKYKLFDRYSYTIIFNARGNPISEWL